MVCSSDQVARTESSQRSFPEVIRSPLQVYLEQSSPCSSSQTQARIRSCPVFGDFVTPDQINTKRVSTATQSGAPPASSSFGLCSKTSGLRRHRAAAVQNMFQAPVQIEIVTLNASLWVGTVLFHCVPPHSLRARFDRWLRGEDWWKSMNAKDTYARVRSQSPIVRCEVLCGG